MDPMCMDERILCCTHSVTGIFMGSNNTVWQSVSSVCSFILCSENWVLSFHFLTLYWKINVFSMIFSNINRIQFQQTMKVITVAYIGKTIKWFIKVFKSVKWWYTSFFYTRHVSFSYLKSITCHCSLFLQQCSPVIKAHTMPLFLQLYISDVVLVLSVHLCEENMSIK